MKLSRFFGIVALAGLAIALAPVPVALGQAPALPFRIRPDGTVDQKELLKLTKQPTASDRITDAELESIKKRHEIDYGPGFRPTEKPEMPPRSDLYASSVLLSDGVNHTLLPEKAVVWVPDSLKDRVVEKPVGRLILWPDFLKQHRDWLRAFEIPFETAKGELPLTEDQVEALRKTPAIVVSVMQGHPISLLAPLPPEGKALVAAAEPVPADPSGSGAENVPAGKATGKADGGQPGAEAAAASAEGKPESSRASRFDTSNRINLRRPK